jgi:hypothetical protein
MDYIPKSINNRRFRQHQYRCSSLLQAISISDIYHAKYCDDALVKIKKQFMTMRLMIY